MLKVEVQDLPGVFEHQWSKVVYLYFCEDGRIAKVLLKNQSGQVKYLFIKNAPTNINM